MAYGQTGSGKTFTMGSEAHGSSGEMNIADSDGDSDGDGGASVHIGLIPRFMADVFASLEEQKRRAASEAAAAAVSPSKPSAKIGEDNQTKRSKSSGGDGSSSASSKLVHYDVSASFLEVYGEDVHDLLDEDRKTLPLREDGTGSVSVVGLKTRSVSTASEALNVLHVGTLHRTTAATLMNHQSSRSHAVFTVHLHQTMRNEESGVDVTTSSRFTFVDLAGSERMKKTGAEGERAREGIKINEGLLALGNVINALADEERLAKGGKAQHVPYRQSKLTRLLQDALGGNSQTLFLACVSPSDGNAPETLSTLHYANRARNIKNAPTKNVDATMLEVQRLHALTYVLQNELVKQMFQDNFSSTSSPGAASTSSSSSSASSSSSTRSSSRGISGRIGQAKAELFERKEVKEYMEKIRRAAEEKQNSGSGIVPSASFSLASVGTSSKSAPARHDIGAASTSAGLPLPASQRPRVGSRDFTLANNPGSATAVGDAAGPSEQLLDAAFLADVDPDGDMAILDQLIEIQHQDQEFDKAQKEDQVQIDQVEGQIEEQEALLLQLKESMKVYHDMKDKYEVLMGEVQSLEAEKVTLARELERVQVDPTKGCSIAIKKKLEKVESSLARARSETRRHQQMYRKAEAEAQKCRVLERKISDLKQGKVALMKKQREAAAKHRSFVDSKTREIHALKKKERKVGQKVSKLEAECQKYKTSLERRRQYCDNLQDKLKQTESHLMSPLAMRKRELQRRTKSLAPTGGQSYRSRGEGGVGRRACNTTVEASASDDKNSNNDDSYAERTEEVKSIKFLLEKMVSDRVTFSQNKMRYEQKVVEYSNLMKMLSVELQAIKVARRGTKSSMEVGGDLGEQNIQSLLDHEYNISDLELKLDLVSAELEDLRTKLPRGEIESQDDEEDGICDETSGLTKSEDSASRMISNLGAPVLRTILWDMLGGMTQSEVSLIVGCMGGPHDSMLLIKVPFLVLFLKSILFLHVMPIYFSSSNVTH